MSKDYFFKLVAADYLVDAKIHAMPYEYRDCLLRLWCLHTIDGSIADDWELVAQRAGIDRDVCRRFFTEPLSDLPEQWRKRLPSHLLKHLPWQIFFTKRDGCLVSPRMEQQNRVSRVRSKAGKQGAKVRYAQQDTDFAMANAKQNVASNCHGLEVRDKKLERERTAELSNFSHILSDETDLRGAQHERTYFEILDAISKRESKSVEESAKWLLNEIKNRTDKKPLAFWLKDGDWNKKAKQQPKMVNPLDLLREQLGGRMPQA